MPWERSADGPHRFEKVDGARPAGRKGLERLYGLKAGKLQARTRLKTMRKVGKVAVERPAGGFVRFEGRQTAGLHALKNNAKGWKSCRRKACRIVCRVCRGLRKTSNRACGSVCCRVWRRDRPCLTSPSAPTRKLVTGPAGAFVGFEGGTARA